MPRGKRKATETGDKSRTKAKKPATKTGRHVPAKETAKESVSIPESNEGEDNHHNQVEEARPNVSATEVALSTDDTVEERCRWDPTSIFAHPTECQLYYDCKVEIIDVNLERHMRECTYPQLYDDKKHECAPYNQVDCGSRTITKDVCDYRIDYCEGRCSDGCLTEFPSCKDKEDGQQEHTGKPRSQHYMVCRDERLMATGVSVEERCRQDSTLVFPHPNECQLYYDCKVGMTDDNLERHMRECKYPKLYDDKKHECVSYWDEDLDCGSRTIYKDVCDYRINYCKTANCNGDCRKELPSCKGMTDGKHKHSGYPDSEYFIVCKDGRLAVTGWVIQQ